MNSKPQWRSVRRQDIPLLWFKTWTPNLWHHPLLAPYPHQEVGFMSLPLESGLGSWAWRLMCSKLPRDGRRVISFCFSHLTVHKKTLSERREATDERKWMVLWGGIKNSKWKQMGRFIVVSPQKRLWSNVYILDTRLKYWQVLASVGW